MLLLWRVVRKHRSSSRRVYPSGADGGDEPNTVRHDICACPLTAEVAVGGREMEILKQRESAEPKLQGLKYFRMLGPLLQRLHDAGTQRDRAGNRSLFLDHYAALLVLLYVNPTLSTLRSLEKASGLRRVRRAIGCTRVSLSSLSEAARVFDADLLQPLVAELAGRLPSQRCPREEVWLRELTAVDGTLLHALPKMAWALWVDDQHRAAKVHLHFEILKGAPVQATITGGNANEKEVLHGQLQSGRFYVLDAGYVKYELFQAILDHGSSFVVRLGTQPLEEALEERPLTEAARQAGVVSDRRVRLGSASRGGVLRQLLRIVAVVIQGRDGPQTLRLVTDRLDLPAELVALAYRYRWQIELFFRWFKCVLGCRHLVSHSANGVRLQVYVALIVSLLISLWTGHKPTKRTLEMIQHYLNGWAEWDELRAHIQSLPKHGELRS